jgi:hypothetical protein
MNSDTGGILGVFGFLVSMAGVIYAAINHKKIRCRCCGKDLDMSVDVDTTEEIKKKTVEEEAAAVAKSGVSVDSEDRVIPDTIVEVRPEPIVEKRDDEDDAEVNQPIDARVGSASGKRRGSITGEVRKKKRNKKIVPVVDDYSDSSQAI